jgi:catechol-2,3-dioxygenase
LPIDHVKLPVADLDASRAFYYAAFAFDPDGHNIEARLPPALGALGAVVPLPPAV